MNVCVSVCVSRIGLTSLKCAAFCPLFTTAFFVFPVTQRTAALFKKKNWFEQGGGEGGVLGQGNVDEIRTQGQEEEAYILKSPPPSREGLSRACLSSSYSIFLYRKYLGTDF
jgi:hypothetical protein